MKRANKTTAAVILALVMALFCFTGCTKTDTGASTLYSTDTLKIEREGRETRIYDLAGNSTYTFTTHRVRKSQGDAERISEAKTTADTETIRLQTAQGIIIATDKTTGTTLYIR